jgi:hypothetical protein
MVEAPREPARTGSGARLGTRRRAVLGIVVVAALAAGVLSGRQCAVSQRDSGPPRDAEVRARIDALREDLVAERSAREALAADVASLRTQIDGIAALVLEIELGGAAADAGTRTAGEAPQEPGRASSADAPDAHGGGAGPDLGAPLFDGEALTAAGLDLSEADRLRQRWERYELDKIELNDRALREGFFMTPRHRDEHRALDAGFRADLGEDGYEAYLVATGKPNRVALRDVIPGSAGSAAGLQPGDEILRYGSTRVFSVQELQLATASGQRGETVPVELLRDGEPITVYVPRGPLGVALVAVERELADPR